MSDRSAIVIAFDRLAAAAIGCYGNPHVETPCFDGLAAESILFDFCYAADVSTQEMEDGRAARLAKSLGRMCETAGIRWSNTPVSTFETEVGEHVASRMEETVAADAPSVLLVRHPGVADDWSTHAAEAVAALLTSVELSAAESELELRPDGADLRARTQRIVRTLAEQGVLTRGASSDSDVIRLIRKAAYFGAVEQIDAGLSTLLEAVRPFDEDCLLIVCAMCGDRFHEWAGDPLSGASLPEELIRVPMLVHAGGSNTGERHSEPVSSNDVESTLVDWFDVRDAIDETFPSLLTHPAADRQIVIRGDDVTVIRSRDAHAELGGQPKLFRKPEDAWCSLDVARQHPAEIDEFEDRVRQLGESTS